jgi:CBS domain-containing membrane protein
MPLRSKPRPPRDGSENVNTALAHLRLSWLLNHFPPLLIWTLYVFVNGFVTIALLALLAVVSETPFVFPSLGPTAYLFFFSPMGRSSSPRNAILGHAIGLACGYGAFWAAGLEHGAPNFHDGVYGPRILAAALSLAFTGAFMVLLRVNHPPAGATTLIVALGILSTPYYLIVIEIAVVLLTAQAFVINRMAGLPYPLWQSAKVDEDRSQG